MELFTSNYRVTGMTCGHCEASITEEVGELARWSPWSCPPPVGH